jgi:hypothetical protein
VLEDSEYPQRVRPELEASPGESQIHALRCELLILIDYALDVGMTDDDIDQAFREVFDARARERRKGFRLLGVGDVSPNSSTRRACSRDQQRTTEEPRRRGEGVATPVRRPWRHQSPPLLPS